MRNTVGRFILMLPSRPAGGGKAARVGSSAGIYALKLERSVGVLVRSSGAVSMLLFAVLALFLPVLFIYRFYVVVKTGRRHQPGRKGYVSVLVVAGSGERKTPPAVTGCTALLQKKKIFFFIF